MSPCAPATSIFSELLAAIEDAEARAVSTAERALLASLDGSCRTPIGGYARLAPADRAGERLLHLTGLVARPDGSFLLKRSLVGPGGRTPSRWAGRSATACAPTARPTSSQP